MKLSKPNEDTLKGIAKFLKDVGAVPASDNTQVLVDLRQQAKALEKDLRQLRASLKELPEQDLNEALAVPAATEEQQHPALNDIRRAYTEKFGAPAEGGVQAVDEAVVTLLKAPVTTNDQDTGHAQIREAYTTVFGQARGPLANGDIDASVVQLIRDTDPNKAHTVNPDPVIFVNPAQLDTGSALIACKRQAEGVFTEALYRKQSQ